MKLMNCYLQAESSARLSDASERGKELAVEVQNNLGFMKSINENLEAITEESHAVSEFLGNSPFLLFTILIPNFLVIIFR